MKFAMYGSGAAGSVFASYLRKGGADIILIDRYEAVSYTHLTLPTTSRV